MNEVSNIWAEGIEDLNKELSEYKNVKQIIYVGDHYV